MSSTIIAWSQGAACYGPSTYGCTDLWGNSLGDALCGTDGGGNFSADPRFCGTDPAASLNVSLQRNSPCAPGQHPPGAEACGLVGARTVACEVAVAPRTWSDVKLLYRR